MATALWVILAAGSNQVGYAADGSTSFQWNIMVVPARQTVYSRLARERFEKNCASCHSKDGRAQTPVARQRHVRDLSESKLADEAIVEQILRGTHDKTVDFRMPPFNEKLSRAEIESLVPVVKAFRSVSSEEANSVEPNPRLAGIMNFPNRKCALLEKVANSGRYFVLSVNESHDGIQLAKVIPEQGTVRLWVSGKGSEITLNLNRDLIHSGHDKAPGFLHRFFDSGAGEHHSLTLDNVNIDLVLFLYAQLTGRTLLRSPHLPATNISLNATATAQAPIVISLQRALAERGITMIPDGEKFLDVVPDSEVSTANARSSEIILGNAGSQSSLAAGGVFINLPKADLRDVIDLYGELAARVLNQSPLLPSNGVIDFTTQTALNVQECSYALETLLSWHGLKVVPIGGDSFQVDLVSDARR